MGVVALSSAELVILGVAGNPFALSLNVSVVDTDGNPISWSEITDPTVYVGSGVNEQPSLEGTITSPSAGVLLVEWTEEQTQQMGEFTPGLNPLSAVNALRWSLSVTIAGVGPETLCGGQLTMFPSTTPGASSSTSASLTAQVGGGSASITVTAGGPPGPTGSTGATGPAGPTGPIGPQGPPALNPTAVKTASYTAAINDLAKFNTTAGAISQPLPHAPADQSIYAAKIVQSAGTPNTLTLTCQGSDVINVASGATSYVLRLLNQAVVLQYQATGALWNIINDDLPLGQLDARFDSAGAAAAAVAAETSSLVGQSVNRLGADPTGVNASDTAFAAAYAALGGDTGQGNIVLGIGTYKLTNFVNKSPNIGIVGPGKAYCRVDSHAVGEDTLRVHDANFNPASAFSQSFFSGKFDGFRIDGTNAGTDASGLHYGDMMGGRFGDILIENFTGTESVGLWMDNLVGWTERMTWSGVEVNNCTTCVKFDVNSGASSGAGFSSYAYSHYGTITVGPLANQDGIVISNGALVVPLSMNITGNCGQSTSGGNTGALLRITGSSTSGGGVSYSSLTGPLNILAETDWDGGSGTPHQTIVIDNNFLNVFNCSGFMDFVNTWVPSNALKGGSAGTFLWSGNVYGDANISDAGSFSNFFVSGGTASAVGINLSGELIMSTGDVFDLGTYSGNITVTFSAVPTQARKIRIRGKQAASGGPFTITWPGSITWLPAAPATQPAGTVAWYLLETTGDGTWGGQALTTVPTVSLPSATAANQFPVSSGAGTTYVATPLGLAGGSVNIASWTLAATDLGLEPKFNTSSPGTVTIPLNLTSQVGQTVAFRQMGAGALIIAGASGVTVQGILTTSGQFQTLLAEQTSSNVWTVTASVFSSVAASLTKVQVVTAASGSPGGSLTVTFAATMAGTTLVVAIDGVLGSNPFINSPPSGWTEVPGTPAEAPTGQDWVAMYYYPNNPGGITSVTFTFNGSTTNVAAIGVEYLGLMTAPLDTQVYGTVQNGGSLTTGAATQTGELVLAAFGYAFGGDTRSVPSLSLVGSAAIGGHATALQLFAGTPTTAGSAYSAAYTDAGTTLVNSGAVALFKLQLVPAALTGVISGPPSGSPSQNGLSVVDSTGNVWFSYGGSWHSISFASSMTTPTYDPAGIAQQVVGTTAVQTVTNKRITRRVLAASAPGATPTIDTDNYDGVNMTGVATAITSMTTNLSGTPLDGDLLLLCFTDNGTARAITWGSSFESSTVTLPATTVISTMLTVGLRYNGATSKWRCIGVA